MERCKGEKGGKVTNLSLLASQTQNRLMADFLRDKSVMPAQNKSKADNKKCSMKAMEAANFISSQGDKEKFIHHLQGGNWFGMK